MMQVVRHGYGEVICFNAPAESVHSVMAIIEPGIVRGGRWLSFESPKLAQIATLLPGEAMNEYVARTLNAARELADAIRAVADAVEQELRGKQ